MNMNKTIWITQTSVFIALLVIFQVAAASFGNPFIPGAAVNFMLITSVMLCGLSTGFTVAAASPVLAKLIGIGPFWSLIPFIMAGNVTLVLVWHFIGNRKARNKYLVQIITLITAAAAKFVVVYTGVVQLAIPLLLDLPEHQAAAVSAMFSTQQLITASIGGAFAVMTLPLLKKALGKKWI